MLLLLTATALADLAPPDRHSVNYTLTIDNLNEYPDHVLLIYPTSNNGFAYVVEADKELSGLMMRAGRRGEGTSLYAMTRADFAEHAPTPSVYDHGDDGAMVSVVPRPPSSTLKAVLNIQPPDLVAIGNPQIGLVRTVHITTLNDAAFELSLVSEEAIMALWEQMPVSGSAPWVVPPTKTRCATAAGGGGLLAITLTLLAVFRRRPDYPMSSPSQ